MQKPLKAGITSVGSKWIRFCKRRKQRQQRKLEKHCRFIASLLFLLFFAGIIASLQKGSTLNFILLQCHWFWCLCTFECIHFSVTDNHLAATHVEHLISIPSPPPLVNQQAGMNSPPPRRTAIREFSGTYESLPARSVQVNLNTNYTQLWLQ